MTRRWPLATRVTVYFLALLVILLLLELALYGADLERQQRERVASATRDGQNAAALVEAFVGDVESTALAMSLAIAQQPTIDQASSGRYLAAVLLAEPQLRSIFVTDARGRVIATGSTGVGVDLASRPYLQELMRGRENVWSGSLTGIETGAITVAYGRRIDAPSETSVSPPGVRGFLIFAFYPERLLTSLNLAAAEDAQITLTDETGLVLYDSMRSQLGPRERDLSQVPEIRRALAGDTVQIADARAPFPDDRRYGAFVPVQRVGWVFAYTRPRAPLDAEFGQRAITNAAVVTLLLLIAAFFVVAIANRLTAPLARLAGTATLIARGERPTVPHESAGGHEVRQLSSAMRAMSESVARREDELRFLAEASEVLGNSLDYGETLRAVARLGIGRFADSCAIDIVEGTELRRVELAYVDPSLDEAARALATELAPRLEDKQHVVVRVIRSGEPVLVSQVSDEMVERAAAGDARGLRLYRESGMRSYMVVPLQVRGATVGAITFAARARRYDEADLALAKDLARRAAAAIDNARLYHEMQVAMRTRDDFLSAVTHELKTPLTSVKGFSQLVLRSLEGRDDGRRIENWMRRIDEAASKMASSVNELLDIATFQVDPRFQLDRRPMNIVELVRDVVSQQEVVSDRYLFHVSAPGEPLTGVWDRARLEQVLRNLLSNAVKYSPSGGEIAVRVSDRGDAAVIEVVDQGIGIPAEDLPRIFERFRRGSNVVGQIAGTGIGLTLVRLIVEQHGGAISAQSIGAGSTFTVTLPKAAPTASRTPDAETLARRATNRP